LNFSGLVQTGTGIRNFFWHIGDALSHFKIDFGIADTATSIDIKDTPIKTTTKVDAGKDDQILSSSGNITLKIPKDAIKTQTDIEITEHTLKSVTGFPSINELPMLRVVELNAKDSKSKTTVTKFEKTLEVRIKHSAQELAGLDPASLHLYYFSEESKQWEVVPGSQYDEKTGELVAGIDHFSVYGETGQC
jgi:hypothetical protein